MFWNVRIAYKICSLDYGLILYIHGLNCSENRIVDVALLLLVEILYVDGGAVLNDNMSFFDPREMSLPDLVGVIDADGDDGAA